MPRGDPPPNPAPSIWDFGKYTEIAVEVTVTMEILKYLNATILRELQAGRPVVIIPHKEEP